MKLKVSVYGQAEGNKSMTVSKQEDVGEVAGFVAAAMRKALRELPVRKMPYRGILSVDAQWVD